MWIKLFVVVGCCFGDIHLAITEIVVHLGYQMVHQESTVNSGSTEQEWKLERYHDEVFNYLALDRIYNCLSILRIRALSPTEF